jgi:hypothetical protein
MYYNFTLNIHIYRKPCCILLVSYSELVIDNSQNEHYTVNLFTFICKLPFSNLCWGHGLFWLGANGFLLFRAASFNCTPHAKCSVSKCSEQGHFPTCSNNCSLKGHYWATAHIANKVGCGRMASFRERYVIFGSCHLCGLLLYSNLSDPFSQNFVHVAGTLTWQNLAYNLINF